MRKFVSALAGGAFRVSLRRLALLSCSLVALDATAAITAATLRSSTALEGETQFVDVTFDRAVCLPDKSNSQDAFTSVLQTRIDGSQISLVVSAANASGGCASATTAAFALPIVGIGTYQVRVAEAQFRLTSPSLFAYREIGSVYAVATPLNVVQKHRASIAIFVIQGDRGTQFYPSTVPGAYQMPPLYAGESPVWQPLFNAWPASSAGAGSELRVPYALVVRDGPMAGQMFYTLDDAEKASLVASGYFAQSTELVAFSVEAPKGGVCAPGRNSIYRAFSTRLLLHRYVPVSTYRTLLENGWNGDGIAFCAAAEPAGPSSWAPN